MPRAPRIAVVGSCNVDLTSFTDEFPRPGETLFGRHFDLGFGGKGANQAVAASLLGAEVHMVGRVGDDLFGPATLRNFRSLGIGARHVKIVKNTASGVAPIFVDASGQNRIVVVKGANDKLMPRDVRQAAPLLRRSDCIVMQLEIPLTTVYHTIRFARKHGVRSILNPAPGQPLDMKEVARVDYLIPNEIEAETITGRPVRSIDQAMDCAAYLLQRGVPRIVITLGDKGALLASRETMEVLPAFPTATKDTTGAGDAFIGAFAVFLAEGLPEREAVRRANLYAAISTMNIGTQKSFVSRSRFNKEWRRQAQR